MSSALELFQLPDGAQVATGLNMPTADEQRLMAAVPEYPERMFMEPKQIQARLIINGQAVYVKKREQRRKRMRNQGGLGKCDGSANAAAAENIRENQGMPDVPLSDCYCYANGNGGADRGMALITTFEQLRTIGISPMQVQVGGVTKTLSNEFYNRRQVDPAVLKQADIEAKRFRGWEFYKAPMRSFEKYCLAIASAVARDHQVIFAWHVGGNSMRLRNGYAVVGRGSGNHANLIHSAKWVGGKTLIHPDDQNSWGPSVNPLYGRVGGQGWGEGGYGLFTMEDVWACAHNHCTYIIPSFRADPNDPAFQ